MEMGEPYLIKVSLMIRKSIVIVMSFINIMTITMMIMSNLDGRHAQK
jgi:hypothetical protein